MENENWEVDFEIEQENKNNKESNMNTKHNQHVTDFMNSDRFDVEAYVDKFITDYNRACYESGNVDKQV